MATKSAVMLALNEHDVNDESGIDNLEAGIELLKLQRQYRIKEGDRKAYSDESRILLRKQCASISKLKVDNSYLINELRLSEERNDDRKRNGVKGKKAEALSEQAGKTA